MREWHGITRLLLIVTCLVTLVPAGSPVTYAAEPIRVLLVDGQNNHDWKSTSPVMKRILEETGIFTVTVVTSPPEKSDMSGFRPDFASCDVILMNYNGDSWPQETRDALIRYMRNGGGMVVVHAADNSFPEWEEYNKMIALGGWGNRDEKWGPYVRWRDGKFVRDNTPGRGGSHGRQHEYTVTIRNTKHPVTKGLPIEWLHARDELYDRLRGPAENLTVLATAYSDTSTGGTGEHEPMLMVIQYGKGRIFHTAMGHDASSISCVGFITTFLRGTEWAATGKVQRTAKVPGDFPGKDKVSVRKY
jgi:type 1 glutamine amidotransferase